MFKFLWLRLEPAVRVKRILHMYFNARYQRNFKIRLMSNLLLGRYAQPTTQLLEFAVQIQGTISHLTRCYPASSLCKVVLQKENHYSLLSNNPILHTLYR